MFWLHKEDVSVPSRSMYRQRNTYQLVLTKRLKWLRTFLITQKYKTYGAENSTFNNKVKAIVTSLQMKQAKEIVEPKYTCPHQNNQSFLYLEKLNRRL